MQCRSVAVWQWQWRGQGADALRVWPLFLFLLRYLAESAVSRGESSSVGHSTPIDRSIAAVGSGEQRRRRLPLRLLLACTPSVCTRSDESSSRQIDSRTPTNNKTNTNKRETSSNTTVDALKLKKFKELKFWLMKETIASSIEPRAFEFQQRARRGDWRSDERGSDSGPD